MRLVKGKCLKKKIKIKIKTILIALSIIFVVIPNSIIALSYLIFNSQWRVTSKNIPVTYFTQGLLNLYVKIPKLSPFEDLAYYIMGNNYYNQNQNLIVSSYGMATKDIKFYSPEKPVEKAIKNYEEAIKGKDSGKYYIKNIFSLIELYWLDGQTDKLCNTIETLKNSKDEEIKNLGLLVEGITHIKNNNYESANKSLDNIAEDYKIPLAVDYYKGTIEILKGNEKAAKEYLFNYFETNKKKKVKKLKYDRKDIKYINMNLYTYGILFDDYNLKYYQQDKEELKKEEELLKRKKEIYINNNLDERYRGSLKGTFKINDIPMKGTLLILSNSGGLYETGTIYNYGNDLKSFAYVDEKGEFYFNNIEEGEYVLSLAIPYNLAINSGLNDEIIRNCLVGEKIKIKKTSDLSEGEKYNNYFITESELGLEVCEGLIEDGIPKPEMKEKEEEESEELIDEGITTFEIKEKDNTIEVSQLNGFENYGTFDGILLEGDFKKGKSIELSKNFLTKDWEYGFVEKVKLIDEGGFFAVFNSGILAGQDEITLSYDEKEIELIKEQNIKALYQYYEKEIEEGRETINKIERLIRLYVLGYNNLGEGKNITKAKDLNNKLKEIRKSEIIYRQIEKFIRYNQYIIV